jgi:hypothetical protein
MPEAGSEDSPRGFSSTGAAPREAEPEGIAMPQGKGPEGAVRIGDCAGADYELGERTGGEG